MLPGFKDSGVRFQDGRRSRIRGGGGWVETPAEGMLIIICVYYRILGIIFSGPKTQFHQCKSFTKLILITGLFGASMGHSPQFGPSKVQYVTQNGSGY